MQKFQKRGENIPTSGCGILEASLTHTVKNLFLKRQNSGSSIACIMDLGIQIKLIILKNEQTFGNIYIFYMLNYFG